MNGVVAYLKEQEDGSFTLLFEDVEALPAGGSRDWRVVSPYTEKTFEKSELKGMSLPQVQFAEIGESLLARLLASAGDRK